MRKMTYDQVKKEMQIAITGGQYDYEIETDTDWITVVPGAFAYYDYNIQLPEIRLWCGITIENINACYPYTKYTKFDIPDANDYGWDATDVELWHVPDDLEVYEDEDSMNDPDSEPYPNKFLIRMLLSDVADKFLAHPNNNNGYQMLRTNLYLVPFETLFKKWLKETDLNQLSHFEHELVMNNWYDCDIAEYLERIASLEVMPRFFRLDYLKRLNEEFCGGRLDLSHFIDS